MFNWYDLTICFSTLTNRLLYQYLPNWRPFNEEIYPDVSRPRSPLHRHPPAARTEWLHKFSRKPNRYPRCGRLRWSFLCYCAHPYQGSPPLVEVGCKLFPINKRIKTLAHTRVYFFPVDQEGQRRRNFALATSLSSFALPPLPASVHSSRLAHLPAPSSSIHSLPCRRCSANPLPSHRTHPPS